MLSIYDKYETIEEVMTLYEKMIQIWSEHTPTNPYTKEVVILTNPDIIKRLILTHFSVKIAWANEKILELQDEVERKKYETAIDEYMDGIDAFNKFQAKVPLTKSELKQQIKNALAHAEYDIYVDAKSYTPYMNIHSPYIEGDIGINDLEELCNYYMSIVSALDRTNKTTQNESLLSYNPNNFRKEDLKEAIKRLRINKNPIELPKDVHMTYIGEIPFETESITPEQMDLIYNYILYVGGQQWCNLPYTEKLRVFYRDFEPLLHNEHNFKYSSEFLLYTLNRLLKLNDQTYEHRSIEFAAPTIYSNFILELGYISLNYIKEAGHKETLHDFKYYDFDLSKIKYWPKSCVKTVTKEEQQSRLSSEIAELSNKLSKWLPIIDKKKKTIESLSGAPLSDEIKQEKISKTQEELLNAQNKLAELQTKITTLQELSDNATGYTNCNEFFKHLRNSISHGFYDIDYNSALENKDLSQTIFTFRDWEIDPNDRSKKQLIFEAQIPAYKLMQLYGQLKEKLVASYAAPPSNKVYIVEDVRTTGQENEEQPEEVTEYLRKRK